MSAKESKSDKKHLPVVTQKKLTTLTFDKLGANLTKAYPYLKWSEADEKNMIALLPAPQAVFSFVLKANTPLANGWRRVMLDELVHPRFKVHTQSIVSNDEECSRLKDYVQNRIWLIPVAYLAPKSSNLQFKIEVKNTSTERRMVTSADIAVVDGKESKFKWDKNIDIISLQPGKSLSVKLELEWGTGAQHGSFSAVGPMTYRVLDYKEPFPKSFGEHPQNYELGCKSQSDLRDLPFLAKLGWITIRDKLAAAAAAMDNFGKDEKLPHTSPTLQVHLDTNGMIIYEFMNESYTLVNILAFYAYMTDKSVPCVFAGDDHPENPSKLVKINHPSHLTLMRAAAKSAIADVEVIITGF